MAVYSTPHKSQIQRMPRTNMTNKTLGGHFKMEEIEINHGDKVIIGSVNYPEINKKHSFGIILTHGAGGNLNSPQLDYFAKYLSSEGIFVLRFTCKSLNIVYRKRVFASVLNWLFEKRKKYGITHCFIGGRSMGCRAAVLCCNELENDSIRDFLLGVYCLSYPLHPVNELCKLRDQPILELTKNCLFISGDEDEMARKDLFKKTIDAVKESKKIEVHWIPGADHSYKIKGKSQQVVNQEIAQHLKLWLTELYKQKKVSAIGPYNKINQSDTAEGITNKRKVMESSNAKAKRKK